MDGLFAIDREAREQRLSLDDRHALRQERANDILAELHGIRPANTMVDGAGQPGIGYFAILAA